MKTFLRRAIDDMHTGHETWRIAVLFSAVSFAIAVAVRLKGI
jgi:hypothetical protein